MSLVSLVSPVGTLPQVNWPEDDGTACPKSIFPVPALQTLVTWLASCSDKCLFSFSKDLAFVAF